MTPTEQDRRIAEEAARQDIHWLGKPASKSMEDAVRIKADIILAAIAEARELCAKILREELGRLERDLDEARARCDALWNEAAKAAVERDQLRAQLAARDEALKVAREALKNCLNNSPLSPFERADAIQAALRRIGELTKGEKP